MISCLSYLPQCFFSGVICDKNGLPSKPWRRVSDFFFFKSDRYVAPLITLGGPRMLLSDLNIKYHLYKLLYPIGPSQLWKEALKHQAFNTVIPTCPQQKASSTPQAPSASWKLCS